MSERAPGRAAGMEHAIVKAYRKTLWQPFIAAVQRYGLIPEGERVHVRLAMDGAVFAAAKLLQEMHRHTLFPFELTFSADGAETAALAAEAGLPLSAPAGGETEVLPECMTDAVETVLDAMLHRGELGCFLPRETRPEGGFLIRPLYCVERRDIRAWHRYCGLKYVPSPAESDPARGRVRALLEEQRRENPNVEISVFRALHAVHLDTFRAFTEP